MQHMFAALANIVKFTVWFLSRDGVEVKGIDTAGGYQIFWPAHLNLQKGIKEL